MKACVIGSPVSHSLSPAIFAYISYHERKKIFYEAREVKTPELSLFLESIKKDQEFCGMNVTIPLKEEIRLQVDSLSLAARTVGAVNVVHVKDKRLEGHNTDVIGIEKTFQDAHFHVQDSVCLLWGAGGSAKAVAFVLGERKAKKVYVYNRGSRGADLAHYYASLYPETTFKAIHSLNDLKAEAIDLMINTTPLGMQGQESGLAYFTEAKNLSFSKRALAFDLIYVPSDTDFLKTARSFGLETIGGLGMLIDQAIATWEIWVGPLNDQKVLHQKLKTFLRGMLALRHDERSLFFTGFMGAGKTTCGAKLSELLRRTFIDTDHSIVETYGKSIPAIFADAGESTFRELETKAIHDCLSQRKVIVSLGGGALKAPVNREAIKKSGILVYLKARPEILKARIDQDVTERPLLQGLSENEKLEKIGHLLKEREVLYQEADVTIETSDKTPEDICFELVSSLGEKV